MHLPKEFNFSRIITITTHQTPNTKLSSTTQKKTTPQKEDHCIKKKISSFLFSPEIRFLHFGIFSAKYWSHYMTIISIEV